MRAVLVGVKYYNHFGPQFHINLNTYLSYKPSDFGDRLERGMGRERGTFTPIYMRQVHELFNSKKIKVKTA